MKIELTNEKKTSLEIQHKRERDRRIANRIKAVLLHLEGWSQIGIAQALRLGPETVHDPLEDYKRSKKLKPENGESESHLSAKHTKSLLSHLETVTYLKVDEICTYVGQTYGVKFTVLGMTKWLHRQVFSYKKPKATPAKADVERQAVFIKYYENLLNTLGEDEPVEFSDGVHPTMATKVTYGWISQGRGHDKPISITALRKRLNLLSSINLETMQATSGSYKTIGTCTMEQHFKKLGQKYPKTPEIHLILDQGTYNISRNTKKAAKKNSIVLHYLPSYSRNFNPIERLWKVINECVRNNSSFQSAAEFRKVITDFFDITWPQIALEMVDRINDNFQTLKKAS